MKNTAQNYIPNVNLTPELTTYEGVTVYRLADSKFVAAKAKRNRWDVINLDTKEFVCQLLDKEVVTWLWRAGF